MTLRDTGGRRAAVAVAIACAALSVVGFAACGGKPAPKPVATASVAARVNGQVVERAEVDRMVALSKLGQKALTYDKALEAVVRQHLLRQEAARLGLSVADAAVEQRLKQTASNLGGVDALTQSLAGAGITLDDYREQLRDAILAEEVAARKFPAAGATRADALAYYRGHPAQFAVPGAVDLQEIVTKTRGQAVQAMRRLRAGESFSAVARVITMDPQARAQGGKLGWVVLSSLPPQLAKALSGVGAGETIGPLQAVGGWHIDKVLGLRRQRTRPFAEVRVGLTHDLSVRAQTSLLARWLSKDRAAATVTKGP